MALGESNESVQERRRGRRWPVIAIVVQLGILGGVLAVSGRFKAVETHDTAGYVLQKWGSAEEVLGGLRTPAYPAFLAVLRAVSSDERTVPTMHFIVNSFAVWLFYFGLQRLGHDSVRAFIGASSLIYTRILYGYVNTVATDTLASAIGIVVCALIMIRLSSPSAMMSLLLSLAVMTGWLIRPAYLFLIPLAPVMTWMIHPGRAHATRSRRWHVLTVFLLVITPLILYSSLRLAVVGRFGIVSFGGGNILGIAGQFLQPADIPSLSQEFQGIASRAIERRDSGELKVGAFDDLPTSNYMRMEDRYDLTIWHIFSDAESGEVERDPVKWNSQSRRLAVELIRLHPREYLLWLIKATRQAVRKVLWDFADNGYAFGLLVMGLGVLLVKSCYWKHGNRLVLANSDTFRILTLFAVVYGAMNLAVVIPVCPPLGRFTDAATVLLAAPLAVWIWDSVVELKANCKDEINS